MSLACEKELVSSRSDGAIVMVWSDHNGYDANITCLYTLTTGNNYMQYIVWLTDIDLSTTTNCDAARLELFDGIENDTVRITGMVT